MHSSFALVALAAAQASAPQESAGVTWVPLQQYNSAQNQQTRSHSEPSNAEASRMPSPAPTVPAPAAEQSPQLAAQPAATGQGPLQLTCVGAGTASKASGAMVYGYGGWASILKHKDRGFNDQVDIRLFNGDDRIRIPRSMLPGIHGGHDGWFKLQNVVADSRSIRASAGVNAFNNPKIFIDRVTGTISISGKAGDYAGQCQVIDANAPAKF